MYDDSGPPGESRGDDPRLWDAIAAIDAANAGDPNWLVVAGVEQPKEMAHAKLMTMWVRELDPHADDHQLIAARAHHLRRWEVPRSTYPEGRSGYLRWRRDLKRLHGDLVAEILTGIGYDEPFIERVQRIVRKEGLGSDPAVQTHEDALCLVFLQTQLDALIIQLGEDATVEVLRKSLMKMSEPAIARAGQLDLSEQGEALLAQAATTSS